MPTPVSAARECLTPEAARALDEAVSVARRRGHGQTTSLHAVSAVLSLPSSPLREACARARSWAYPARLQLKALELCLGVSLDRVSSSSAAAPAGDPPVSNSLMAAIKRSQANQRRQPENYHHHHHHQQQASAVACVRVELHHLTLSILDDPLVSRVFGEAGFRSSDIKIAVLRPFSHLLRYRGPPVFLCNLSDYPTRIHHSDSDSDSISRRIGEILSRAKGRNPLLVGASAHAALRSFADAVRGGGGGGVLPPGLAGLTLVSIEASRGLIERCSGGAGVVFSVGDLGEFAAGDGAAEAVGGVTRLLEVDGGKAWVIGATASYETYLKFVTRFPSVEKDWDLQLLPITSLTSSSSLTSMADSYPRSSFTESFVPFGGFFSAPSDLKFPLSGPIHSHLSRSQEASLSAAEPCQPGLPSWLQMASFGPNKGLDAKTKGGGELLSADVPRQAENFPTVVGFRSSSGAEGDRVDLNSPIPVKERDESFSSGLCEKAPKSEEPESSLSPTGSVASVTTDVGLGISLSGGDRSRAVRSSSPSSLDAFDPSNAKALFRALVERVGWQREAASAVSQAIARRRAREKSPGPLSRRGDTWLGFAGPDRVGKKRIALALAEVLYGKRENSICVDLGSRNETIRSEFRGKNVVDYVAAEMGKKPLAVVFLENVDKSDVLVRRSLSRAISTGKFSDSYGREVSTNNTTFVTTCSSSTFSNKYSKERVVSKAKYRPMRIVIESPSSPVLVNKRKPAGSDAAKRARKKHIDLNLPAEEEEAEDEERANSDGSAEAWLRDFFDRLDERVIFKPVDLDAIAEKISKLVKDCFDRTVHLAACVSLEIGPDAMEQLIAAVYFSDEHRVVEDWVEKVLTEGFEEAQRRHSSNSLSPHSVVKLVTFEGLSFEDQPQTCYLPNRIIIN